MAFTDNDLKRLKEDMEDYLELLQFKIDALLARLEAAERYIDGHKLNCCADLQGRGYDCTCGYEAWREAKGE